MQGGLKHNFEVLILSASLFYFKRFLLMWDVVIMSRIFEFRARKLSKAKTEG